MTVGCTDTPEFELAPYEGAGGPGYVQCSQYEIAVRTKAESVEGCHALCADEERCKMITYYPHDAITQKNHTGNGAGDEIIVKDHNDWPKSCFLIENCGDELQVNCWSLSWRNITWCCRRSGTLKATKPIHTTKYPPL